MSENVIDEESQRLIDELEGQASERAALEARAMQLGVKFMPTTKDSTLAKRVAEAEAQQAETTPQPDAAPEASPLPDAVPVAATTGFTLVSTYDRPLRIHGIELPRRGASATLSKIQQEDGRLMMKVQHAIKLGMVIRGAD